ncbi:MAG: PepSY domain-containing protein [Maricaulaceae bacterium]
MMSQRNAFRYMTRAHKWAGLVLGLQILLWFLSGFIMSLFPINEVRGRHLVDVPEVSLQTQNLIPLELAMSLYEGELSGAKLITAAGHPAYVLIGDNGEQIIDAVSGDMWSELTAEDIQNVAERLYKGEGEVKQFEKLLVAPREYRGPLPVWQIEYKDKDKTRLYLDAKTAELKAVRTRVWRVFDFMWMLHIMDYKERENFNSWWLRLFSGAAVLFALSGLGLVAHRIFMRPRKLRKISN